MLSFADNAWQVFSCTIVFCIGLWIAIAQKRIFRLPQTNALIYYLWHTFFCCYYYYYSLLNPADSKGYFFRSFDFNTKLGFGTEGIIYLVSFFSVDLGFSYGGIFLVFNIIGYIGMLAFASALQQILVDSSRRAKQLAAYIMLLPELSFWTSAIGKDAITFLGAGLAVWAAIDVSRRYPALVLSVLAYLFPRPHMAGILLGAIACALIFSSRIALAKKIVLTFVMFPIAIAGIYFGLQFVGLGEISSASDVEDYFATRQSYNIDGGSSVAIADMSVPVRLATYLFRPLFFDTKGLLDLVVSIENLLLLVIIGTAFFIRILGRKSRLNAFAKTLLISFVIVSWFILASTTANLGIAIRQKWMFLPMLLLLSFSTIFRAKRR